MKEYVEGYSGNIYIRNKKEAKEILKITRSSLDNDRVNRLMEAVDDNDMFYLSNTLSALSTFDIFKIIVIKALKKIKFRFKNNLRSETLNGTSYHDRVNLIAKINSYNKSDKDEEEVK